MASPKFHIFFTHKKRCLFSVGKIIFGTSFFQVSCEWNFGLWDRQHTWPMIKLALSAECKIVASRHWWRGRKTISLSVQQTHSYPQCSHHSWERTSLKFRGTCFFSEIWGHYLPCSYNMCSPLTETGSCLHLVSLIGMFNMFFLGLHAIYTYIHNHFWWSYRSNKSHRH